MNMRVINFIKRAAAVLLFAPALAIGAGHSTFAMLSSFANCIVFRVVLSLLFNHLWGIYGLYAACAVAPSISVPLGWLMIHSMMAFHYASLWYAPGDDGQPMRGLGFPGLAEGQDAQLWDFIYYSFTIGLASQTADVSALTTRMRRITLLHSVFAFYYNTVVLALAVNAAASLG